MKLVRRTKSSVLAGIALAYVITVSGAQVSLNPAADTTLIEVAPTNNLGGQNFVNAGTTQNFTKNRGLFRFDILSAVPAGSRITSAMLILEVTKQPSDGFTPAPFSLFRLLKPWGEGNKTGTTQFPGIGDAATLNEATWNDRFALTTNSWTLPGSAATNDYVSTSSASQLVYGTVDSPYVFGSTARMVSDVQLWLDQPQTNFGWILITQDESANFTARRFGSREAGIDAPRLEIEFVPPPILSNLQSDGNGFQFTFVAEPGQPYTVQFRNAFAGTNSWATLTNIPASSERASVTVSDSLSINARFYRVVAP